MTDKRYRWAAAPLLAALIGSGCSSSAPRGETIPTIPVTPAPLVPPTTPVPRTTPTPTTTVAATTASPTTTPPPTVFSYTVGAVSAQDVPYTWHAGCPVSPSQLSQIHLVYWGFDGATHPGTIIVNTSVVTGVVQVFRTLFGDRFPLHEVVPEDAYHGNDNAAASADDTSGFNCRDAVSPGPPQWSVHAYGEAIDVNDVQNPYVDGSTVIPPAGAAYENRADIRPGMAYYGGVLVDAFASVGWQWGGRWTGSPDYQHFSSTGG